MEERIPGTIIPRGMDSGEHLLEGVFSATSGVVLSQIRELSGLESSAIQNWVKRGWVSSPLNKKYNENQVARILIINMLRDVLKIENITMLLVYINGDVNNRADDIIPEAQLFAYICRIYHLCTCNGPFQIDALEEHIDNAIVDYQEVIPRSRHRLKRALQVIITAYRAKSLRDRAMGLLQEIREEQDA